MYMRKKEKLTQYRQGLKRNYAKDAHTYTHTHTHTPYRLIGVVDNVALLKYSEKRNVEFAF